MSCVTATDIPQQSSRLGRAKKFKRHVPFPLLTGSQKLDCLGSLQSFHHFTRSTSYPFDLPHTGDLKSTTKGMSKQCLEQKLKILTENINTSICQLINVLISPLEGLCLRLSFELVMYTYNVWNGYIAKKSWPEKTLNIGFKIKCVYV